MVLNVHRGTKNYYYYYYYYYPNSKHWFTTSFLQPLPYLVTS